MIHAEGHIANHLLQMGEIIEQANRIKLWPLERDAHLVIMAVHVLALPFVSAQGMARGKSLIYADLERHYFCRARTWSPYLFPLKKNWNGAATQSLVRLLHEPFNRGDVPGGRVRRK